MEKGKVFILCFHCKSFFNGAIRNILAIIFKKHLKLKENIFTEYSLKLHFD